MTGQHWTNRNVDAFAYAVASNFIAQLETKLDVENMEDKTLAMRAKVSPAYISQIFSSPGNMGVKTMAKLTNALDMKFAIVAYVDHDDPRNDSGPIGPEVFRWAWEKCGRPRELPMLVPTATGEFTLPYMKYFSGRRQDIGERTDERNQPLESPALKIPPQRASAEKVEDQQYA